MSETWRSFHISTIQPSGFKIRVNSARVAGISNQWKACPATTKSAQASGSVVASAVAATLTKRACFASSRSPASRISGFGSTP